jgi:hypothetical protein
LILTAIYKIEHKDLTYLLDHELPIVIVTAVCGTGLLVHYIYELGGILGCRWKRKRLVARLENSASNEKNTLRRFRDKNSTIECFLATSDEGYGIPSLLADGILFPAEPHYEYTVDKGQLWCRIESWTLKYLKETPFYLVELGFLGLYFKTLSTACSKAIG